jgi:hypothetical protein
MCHCERFRFMTSCSRCHQLQHKHLYCCSEKSFQIFIHSTFSTYYIHNAPFFIVSRATASTSACPLAILNDDESNKEFSSLLKVHLNASLIRWIREAEWDEKNSRKKNKFSRFRITNSKNSLQTNIITFCVNYNIKWMLWDLINLFK